MAEKIKKGFSKFKIPIIIGLIIIPVILISVVLVDQQSKRDNIIGNEETPINGVDMFEDVLLHENVLYLTIGDTYLLKILELEGRYQAVYGEQIDFELGIAYSFEYDDETWVIYNTGCVGCEPNIFYLMKKSIFDEQGTGINTIVDLFQETKPITYNPTIDVVLPEFYITTTIVSDNNGGWNTIYLNTGSTEYITIFHLTSTGYGYYKVLNLDEATILSLLGLDESGNIIYGNYGTGKVYMFKYQGYWWYGKYSRTDDPDVLINAISEYIGAETTLDPNNKYTQVNKDLTLLVTKISGTFDCINIKINGLSKIATSLVNIENLISYGLEINSGEPRIFFQDDGNAITVIFKYGNTWFIVENIIADIDTVLNSINYKIYARDLV